MRDFVNFEIMATETSAHETRFVIRHKNRDGLSVEFSVPNDLEPEMLPSIITVAMKRYSQKYSDKSRKPMTGGQKHYYDKLVEFHKMEGRAPTYDEQCYMLGVKSKGTPHHYAKKLADSGWVWIDGRMVIPYDIAEPDMEDSHE